MFRADICYILVHYKMRKATNWDVISNVITHAQSNCKIECSKIILFENNNDDILYNEFIRSKVVLEYNITEKK